MVFTFSKDFALLGNPFTYHEVSLHKDISNFIQEMFA